MHFLFGLFLFLLCSTALVILYCCVAIQKNKNTEFYDDKWYGKLKITEHYNQPGHSEFFWCENHYEHMNAEMTLIIGHARPPREYELEYAGLPRVIQRAKVIELEGRYFWEELS